ncbi:hypothetical protein [Spirosoma sp. 48-14]|uniref:hypothetical protein n=1 Tax=Spirosoma sp. 48-14 TaxID=1895854 RepID=UPI000A8523C8|nr:hypothetical protein [Spirosoma sp. 48-14]
MATKKQIQESNAISFAQLLEELLEHNDKVEDVYYSDHIGNWCIKLKDGEADEFCTFSDLLNEHFKDL